MSVASSKTTAGLIRLLILASQYPRSQWVVFRQTYIDLQHTTRRTFREKVCPSKWIKRDVKETTTLANDANILWLHLDEMNEQFLRGWEGNGGFGDQVEEVNPELVDLLHSRLGRWQMPEWKERCPAYLWYSSNPKGKDSVYYRFDPRVVQYDHIKHYKKWDDENIGKAIELGFKVDRDSIPPSIAAFNKDKAYFFGSSLINLPKLNEIDPGIVRRLLAKPESWKKIWVYGTRDFFEGTIHAGFREEVHTYDPQKFDPFQSVPVRRVMGWFDYGISHPTTLILSASNEENFHFIFHEYGAPNRTIAQHAEQIRKLISQYNIEAIFADPMVFYESTRDRKVMTKSVAEEYALNGVQLIKADNNEETSIEKIEEYLQVKDGLMNPVTRALKSPRIFISKSCPNLIREIQQQRRKETRNAMTGEKEFLDERDPTVADDFYDGFRYFANFKGHDYRPYLGPMHTPSYNTAPKYGGVTKPHEPLIIGRR